MLQTSRRVTSAMSNYQVDAPRSKDCTHATCFVPVLPPVGSPAKGSRRENLKAASTGSSPCRASPSSFFPKRDGSTHTVLARFCGGLAQRKCRRSQHVPSAPNHASCYATKSASVLKGLQLQALNLPSSQCQDHARRFQSARSA